MLDIITSPYALSVLTFALGGIGYLFRRIYRQRLGHSIIARLGAYAETAVLATYAEYVEAIKLGRADGKLTDEERREAKRRAMAKLWSYADLGVLVSLFGSERAETLAGDIIETAVIDTKGFTNSVRPTSALD